MRDLKRFNAKLPAYKQLQTEDVEVFTPMRWKLTVKLGKRMREKVPFIQDLLFVHDTRKHLDAFVEKIPTLQYRYQKGAGYCEPMIVPRFRYGSFYLCCKWHGSSPLLPSGRVDSFYVWS